MSENFALAKGPLGRGVGAGGSEAVVFAVFKWRVDTNVGGCGGTGRGFDGGIRNVDGGAGNGIHCRETSE